MGGCVGSLLRAFVGCLLEHHPLWATVCVNLVGAFAIGFLGKFSEQSGAGDLFRAFWMIGLCGGFTTFSSFGMDLFVILQRGAWIPAFAYASSNLIGTIFFVWVGYRANEWYLRF